jgi:hypothetical protein
VSAAFEVGDLQGAPTAIFPRLSLDPATRSGKPLLDMATIFYDGSNCYGGEYCDVTSKLGVRQWQFPTLAFSSFPSTNASGERNYGVASIYKRAVNAYFGNRPYQNQQNGPAGALLRSTADGRPMLAPITDVGDNSSRGGDNGVLDAKELLGSDGSLLGDRFVSNTFGEAFDRVANRTTPPNMLLSAMDANNDYCVELPFISDPSALPDRCDPRAPSATGAQATKQQVVRLLAKHELGHAVGITIHTADAGDIMYQYSNRWDRDGFSSSSASMITITNGGAP